MSSTANFPAFGSLPNELQLLIWEEALALVTVLSLQVRPGEQLQAQQPPPIAMDFHGPRVYNAGLCCRTARRLMEQTFVRPGRLLLASANSACWVDLDRAVVHIGEPLEAAPVLDAFEPGDLPRVRHVAMKWHPGRYESVARACQVIAARCENLQTLTIHRCGVKLDSDQRCRCLDLSEETAAYYATIPDYSGPLLCDNSIDSSHTRSLLLQYFKNPPPRLHLLSREAVPVAPPPWRP